MAQGLANLPGEVDIWWRILEDVVRQSAPFAGARCASLGRLDRRHRGQVDQGRLWHLALTSDGERLRLADMVRCRGAQFVIDYTAASLADGKGAEVKRFYVELHHRHLLRELLNVMHTRSGKRKLQLPSRGGPSGDVASAFIEAAQDITRKVPADAIERAVGVAPAVETRLRSLAGEKWWQLAHVLMAENAARATRCARLGQQPAFGGEGNVHGASSSKEVIVLTGDDQGDE